MKDVIFTINANTRKVAKSKDFLGINGENLQNNIIFDFADEFINGIGYLETDDGTNKYLIQLTKVDEHYILPIYNSLLATVGNLTCQFRANIAVDASTTAIFKSEKFIIPVLEAINAEIPIPEEYPTWLEQADLKLAEVEEATDRANAISEDMEEKRDTDYYVGVKITNNEIDALFE